MEELKGETVRCLDKDNRYYNSSFREMVYNLLKEHVGLDHVGPVIETVLKFVNKKADKLPCEKTIRTMNIERLHLAQDQLCEEFSQKSNTTTYSDETSKFGKKFIGFHATDMDKRYWVLGIRDLATKSADDTLSTFKEVLQDIDDKKRADDTSDVAKKILKNIQNTMSDRAATEMKWHEMLENYRRNILPEVVENWKDLTEDEKAPLERLRNFYCGLHTYVQVAQVAGSTLLELENKNPIEITGPQIVNATEPGTVRLIRTAAKAFARGGDEKSGVYGDFMDFEPLLSKLKESNLHHLPIVPFRGNRFNIVFFNGGFVYFLHKEMIQLLEGREKPNPLLKAVLADFRIPFVLAGCKAFGLISKLVMGPLWRIIENNNIHIFKLGEFMTEILNKLQFASDNISSFMNGQIVCSSSQEWKIKKDAVYEYLIAEDDNIDHDVEIQLGLLLPAIGHQLKEHFEQLMSYNGDDDLEREQTESVVPHNKFAERVFAYTDQLLRFKPNIHHLSQEAYVMFCLNKTGEWLGNKPQAEKESKIDDARKGASNLQALYQARQKRIKEQRAENLKKKREAEAKRQAKQMQEREMIFKEILYYTLYQSKLELENGLSRIEKDAEKTDALKAQLRFREQILLQKADAKLFRFSEKAGEKRRNLSWIELKDNCLLLIEQAIGQASKLPRSSEEPSKARFLIGRKILHKMINQKSGKLKGYKATVISAVPGFPSWFNFKYDPKDDGGDDDDDDDDDEDEDPDTLYVEKLQEQVDAGNVILLP